MQGKRTGFTPLSQLLAPWASGLAVCQPEPSAPQVGGTALEWLIGCIALSSAKVPDVPLISFPGQAHRGGASRVPAGDQWSQLLYSGSLAVESVANTVILTAVYYKLVHSFRPCCSVTGCHSDRPGS